MTTVIVAARAQAKRPSSRQKFLLRIWGWRRLLRSPVRSRASSSSALRIEEWSEETRGPWSGSSLAMLDTIRYSLIDQGEGNDRKKSWVGNKELEGELKLKLRLSAVRWPGLAAATTSSNAGSTFTTQDELVC